MAETEGNGQAAPKAWVYREVREQVPAGLLVRELEACLAGLNLKSANCSAVLDALLRSGELECALADRGWEDFGGVGELTDALADLLVGNPRACLSDIESARQRLSGVADAGLVTVSPPEGFAYYALHPLDFAALGRRFADEERPAAVIGVRSIGTVLSAVVAAAIRSEGWAARRITVRPSGHPYDRQTRFSAEQVAWVAENNGHRARFLLVDEGPGLSGSSFLSVAEALLEAGVSSGDIALLGSREVDPRCLCAENSAARWSRFRFHAVAPKRYAGFVDGMDISGGGWRQHLLGSEADWPACWPQVERLKFLSSDRRSLLKFEGLGRWGVEAHERALALAEAGFAPRPHSMREGMVSYSLVDGTRGPRPELTASVLKRLAQYCAFRAREFRVSKPVNEYLAEMVRFNAEQELGFAASMSLEQLRDGPAVIVDGRMHPHEWIVSSDGRWLKTDGVSHGDDHFFPGPVDIAWDLAGAIVEWNMPDSAGELLLRNYVALTGDNARARIDQFVFAYSVFRMAFSGLAMRSVGDAEEHARLARVYRLYKIRAESVLHSRVQH